ncbi:MobP3 family relaxase [uncultured Parasutterella sp.]|uniref:MobP3 family relaxase n=1 Tax=uncultured Parasutterella sp. TaxID=1263098 RepID=UPI002711E76A|nr:MobP3 family relaxase [uncultured Parasutterella sp.]
MPRLIFKCPYIKGKSKRAPAHLKNMVNYIATRDGAERIDPGNKNLPATEKQKELIEQLTREFPLSRGLFEYSDFTQAPTQENASEFITRALEDNLDQIAKRENYLEYIAKRPRAVRMGAHGLFNGSEDSIVLSQVAEEIAHHSGNVWLPIISLRREDAERLGYDNAENWRSLLSSNAMEIAKSMKIPWEDFRWYAAFHDEGNHPHVHMVCYSVDPSKGFLTSKGIESIKSMLAKQIFRQELTEIYSHQTKRRDELTRSAGEAIRQLAVQMQDGTLDNERIEQLMKHLSEKLKTTSGKKKYGYLKAPLKSVVDEIVDELCKDPRVARAYDLWYELREDVLKTYKDTMPERVPLSQQKEFKRIKNLVIEEAVRMSADRQSAFSAARNSDAQMRQPISIYQSATRLLHHMGNIFRDQQPPADGALRVSVDSKLRQKIREKKMALGHKADDHENTINM